MATGDEKKRKHSEVVNGDEEAAQRKVKKEKKDKKDKKSSRKSLEAASAAIEQTVAGGSAPSVDEDGDVKITQDNDESMVIGAGVERPHAILVPFANPLAQDKLLKKVLKGTKKAAKAKTLKRGVKECVKAINKSTPNNPSTTTSTSSTIPSALAVFAADIWPMDVISHMPVLCEDHAIPYVYVDSRAELGRASGTKRPTSVVVICRDSGKKGKKEEGDAEGENEWRVDYEDLVKAVEKAGRLVKV